MTRRQHVPPEVDALAAEPVDLDGVLDDVRAFVERFVVLPSEAAAVTVALWIAHTHSVSCAHATPYVLLVSPERESGKTLALEVMELLVARPWRAASATEAAVFRKIHAEHPTLLFDEIDALFGSSTERTEGVRAILNAGNRAGAVASRCVGKGSDQKVVDFDVYCAKALAGIDTAKLPDTIRSRSIEIRMRRRKAGEAVEDFFPHLLDDEAGELRDRLARWAIVAAVGLRDARPGFPEGLRNRAKDAWWPLLAIADLAGGQWPIAARQAAIDLAPEPDSNETHGARILRRLRDLIDPQETVMTKALAESLNADDDLSFGGWNEGQGISTREVSKHLRHYEIKQRSIRVDGTSAKGYRRDADLEDAFARWLPDQEDDLGRPPQEAQAGAVNGRSTQDVEALAARLKEEDW